MSSSSNRPLVRKTKGFSQQEIRTLQSQGSGMSVGMLGQQVETPEQKTRTNRTVRRSGGLFRSPKTHNVISGFMGQMSNMSQEDVQRLADSVRKRRTVLQEQARRPGRRQLMAGS